MKAWGLVGAVVTLAASTAFGQLFGEAEGNHVCLYKFRQTGWTYHVIYSRDAGTVQAQNILALADPQSVAGENLKAVWYIRNGQAWEAKSWEVADQYAAVKEVAAQLGITDADAWRWDLAAAAVSAAVPAGVPASYVSGMLESDPLLTVVQSSGDRDGVIELLAAIGYKVADIPAEKTGQGNCDETSVLWGMAAATEFAITYPAASRSQMAVAYAETVILECGGVPGDKANVGLIDWTTPTLDPVGPTDPPQLDGCFDNLPGLTPARICLWTVPGDYKQRKWCLKFLPPDQQGPPYALCEQERDRGQCNPQYQCPGDVTAPAVPPCQLMFPRCDNPPGPWRTVQGDCTDCPHDGR